MHLENPRKILILRYKLTGRGGLRILLLAAVRN